MNSSSTTGGAKLLLTVEEAAHALGLGRSKTYDLISKGTIPSIKIHGSRRVPLGALSKWIEEQVASENTRREETAW